MAIKIEKLPAKLSERHTAEILHALAAGPGNFIWFGGTGSAWTIIPINHEPIIWSEFSQSRIAPSQDLEIALPFTGGIVGIVPYETYTGFTDGPAPSAFTAKGSVVRDNRTGETYICASHAKDFPMVTELANDMLNAGHKTDHSKCNPINLIADSTADRYENMIERALENIRDGRFYQINLLRFFRAEQVNNTNLTQLITSRGGPFSSWFRFQGQEIVSFSPEQFVAIRSESGKSIVTTSPIKGTAARHRDPELDRKFASDLQKSPKNLAELHMIIDLMRNDLNRICQPGSVTVLEKNKLLTFANVHHLAGTIEGHLKNDLTVDEFLRAVCPGGSITGAPKIEVVRAIREFEQRPRGYFMGHAFMQDTFGQFNSSVLIRTLAGTVGNAYEFSAGSGIVIHSEPSAERLEIDAKCNVLRPQEHS